LKNEEYDNRNLNCETVLVESTQEEAEVGEVKARAVEQTQSESGAKKRRKRGRKKNIQTPLQLCQA
jgi:hypothetical protein